MSEMIWLHRAYGMMFPSQLFTGFLSNVTLSLIGAAKCIICLLRYRTHMYRFQTWVPTYLMVEYFELHRTRPEREGLCGLDVLEEAIPKRVCASCHVVPCSCFVWIRFCRGLWVVVRSIDLRGTHHGVFGERLLIQAFGAYFAEVSCAAVFNKQKRRRVIESNDGLSKCVCVCAGVCGTLLTD